MTIYATLNRATDQTRAALVEAHARARAAGDSTEMARLKALVIELDALRRRMALGALADAVATVEEIRAGLAKPPVDEGVDPPKDGGSAAGDPPPIPSDPDTVGTGGAGGDAPDGTGTGATAEDGETAEARRLAWGAAARRKHGDAFNRKVEAIAGRLGCDANHLMAAMAFETAETFSPSIRNAAGSGATGLIQFMPATARRLGTTTDRLAAMTALDQLDYVEAYFRSATGRPLHTLSDVYMAILWPAAVGKPDSHVLFREPARAYTMNRGFDINRDGIITKAEAAEKVQKKLVKGMKEGRVG